MSLSARRQMRWLVLAAAFAVLASGCSIEETLPIPDCISGESGLIVAQSVPTAEEIPCFEELPDGWERSTVTITEDGTVVGFDSDRAGTDAAVMRFTTTCAFVGAIQVPSDQADAHRFEFIERLTPGFRGSRHYVFTGGCVTWEFDFDDGAPTALALEIADRLTLISREALNANIRETFIDEEL